MADFKALAALDLAQKNSSQIGDLSTKKAEKTYVDQQITNIGNASPKGTYATLTALQAAFPTGTTGIYVITADGKWYYWNGTVWTAGGVYQATAFASNAGDQLVASYNLADSSKITSGAYLGTGGVPVTDNYAYSDYIVANAGDVFTFYGAFSKSFQGAVYDSSKTFVKTIYASDCTGAYGNYHYVVPSNINAAYIRFNMGNNNQLQSMVLKGNITYPSTYTAYGTTLLSNSLAQGIKNTLGLEKIYADENYNTTLGALNLTNKNATKYATAIGYGALKSNTTDGSQDAGLYNTAVGYLALTNNTIGNHNTAVGWMASQALTTGTGNTSVGQDSLLSETTGVGNTAVGQRALQKSVGSNNNTAIGVSAMYWDNTSNVTGTGNTAIGRYAGSNITSDTDLVFLGHFASKDSASNVYTNSSAIGSNAKINKSNQVRLGSSSVLVVDTYADLEILSNGKGLILRSPNGSKFKMTVSDAGAPVFTTVA